MGMGRRVIVGYVNHVAQVYGEIAFLRSTQLGSAFRVRMRASWLAKGTTRTWTEQQIRDVFRVLFVEVQIKMAPNLRPEGALRKQIPSAQLVGLALHQNFV